MARSVVYTSCGCNRTPHAADWGLNGLIAFGACRAVAICRPNSAAEVLAVLTGHTGRVNSVRWIKQCSHHGEERELVSVSSDCTAIVWTLVPGPEPKFSRGATLTGHASVVTVSASIYVPCDTTDKPHTLIATASADFTVKIWRRPTESAKFQDIQTLHFGNGFALDLDWVILPGTKVAMLGCACDDHKVHLYVQQADRFVCVHRLSGHEDWITGLTFTTDDIGDLLLATCSQDCSIRLWRISVHTAESSPTESACRLDSGTKSNINIKATENLFTFSTQGADYCYSVSLESILQGHDGWVYSVCWQPCQSSGRRQQQPMCLLSASMDKTMIVWRPDKETGIWVDQVRVGEVGGGTLGFYGGVFGPDGKQILAHGYQGALHLWQQLADEDATSWVPGVTCGGHFDAVSDIAWEPNGGQFLLSASMDQTTRLHGCWQAQSPTQESWQAQSPTQSTWIEIARPQIHGFDMQCLAVINSCCFASGADEKVIRVFAATQNFIDNFQRVCQCNITADLKEVSLPDGASVPALGLSNKAHYLASGQPHLYEQAPLELKANPQYEQSYFTPLTLTEPPSEDNLLQNTLWPEVQKLYGHTTEVFALAAHPQGTYLASASKAAKPLDAFILVWDTSSWQQVCRLEGHSLTVTQLAFSHSGHALLAVSRDRTWSVYRQRRPDQAPTDPAYSRVAFTEKKTSIHTRIIWSCAWTPDDAYFITVSRDKKAVVWSVSGCGEQAGDYTPCSTTLELSEAITAIDIAPLTLTSSRFLLAVGLDSGAVLLYTWCATPNTDQPWTKIAQLTNSKDHELTVKRLRFRPLTAADKDSSKPLMLASCGADHMVKIYTVDLSSI